MQVRNAAIAMIAMRNPAACRALEATGTIGAGSCGGRRTASVAYVSPRPARVRAAPAQPARRQIAPVGIGNCKMVFATATTQKKVCG
jgi:hypothetical protein